MNYFQKIFTGSFFLLLSGVFLFFGGYQELFEFCVILFLYSMVLYGIYRLWNLLRKKQAHRYTLFLKIFLYKTALTLCIFFVLFGSFLGVQNELNPAKLPLYTLSNGEKSIIFQTMSHIGSEAFYTQVQTHIREAKKQDFVLFYEGVGPGSQENLEAFNHALGVKFDTTLYEKFSKLYGVVAQDNDMFLDLENTKDYNIDLNLDEVMNLYYEKVGISQKSLTGSRAPENISLLLKETLEQLSKTQLSILQYINQSLLNFIVKHDAFRNTLMEKFGNPDIFHVILEDRNKHLVQEILTSKDKKIFILYGLMHFDGVLELLQSHDPKWQIIDTSWHPLISPTVLK